jgi:phosphopantetheine--protein transferase-like protein
MGRVLGCGIDIEELDRFSQHVSFRDGVPGFLAMVFTEEEISRNREVQPQLTFPLAFSCKEALFKAFGKSWTNSPLSWKDIEVIFKDGDGKLEYQIRLNGYASQLFKEMGCVRMESSFEFDDEIVVFEVLFLS